MHSDQSFSYPTMQSTHSYFGSGTGLFQLSNFFHCGITLTSKNLPPLLQTRCPVIIEAMALKTPQHLDFPSLEHLYQGTKAADAHTLLRFTTLGDLGAWNPSIFDSTLVPKKFRGDERAEKVAKKVKYWQRKNAIGILAKIAANEKYGKALGLGSVRMRYQLERLSPADERTLWLSLLRLKYAQNPPLLAILSATGTSLLIEFDRGASRGSHWGGLWDAVRGQVVGENVMGRYLSEIRAELTMDSQ